MTAVLVFGDLPNTGHVPRSGTERVIVGGGDGAVEPDGVIDLVRQRLHAAGYVIAIYPSWQPEPSLRALRLTRVGLGTERLLLAPSALPPLALSLVADQLGYLAPYCPPGALVAIMSALERVTLSGAWVRSVAGLEHIPASLSDHVASYVPGGGFMVTAAPSPRIHRITGQAPLGELPYRPADPVHVLTAGSDGGDTEWLEGHLLPAVRAQHVRPLAPPPPAGTYWGTKKYVEFVAFSGHPKALSVIANSVTCRPCPWCGEPVATSTCPLCGMTAPHRPEPHPPPTAAPPTAAQPPAARPHSGAADPSATQSLPNAQPPPAAPPPAADPHQPPPGPAAQQSEEPITQAPPTDDPAPPQGPATPSQPSAPGPSPDSESSPTSGEPGSGPMAAGFPPPHHRAVPAHTPNGVL